MTTSPGILSATGLPITNPLPISWLGKALMPATPPTWATISTLTATQLRNLQAEIAYDQSLWNYMLIGNNNALGAYQISTQVLENYGLLATGSNAQYGTNCVNYRNCWRQVLVRNSANSYANYLYNIQNINGFLTNNLAQGHLAYQYIFDLYNGLLNIGAIDSADTTDIIAGMIYVAWNLGVGTPPSYNNATGTGAYAWRYYQIGTGANAFNSGRYAITVLSQ